MKKNKRAQFFIIGAVILGIIILGMATMWNVTLKGKEDIARKKFFAVCENYRNEVFEISRYALASGNKSNESSLILDVTIKFLEYVKASEPDFNLIYVYGNSTNVTVLSYTDALEITPSMDLTRLQNGYFIGNSGGAATIESVNISITNTNINKQYAISEDERFYFIALEKKDGELYVCE